MQLSPGQIVVLAMDGTWDSQLTGVLIRSRWTHVCLVLNDGTVLNTYPATDCVILPQEAIVTARDYVVLDAGLSPEELRRVLDAATTCVGMKYWLAPCSVVTAMVFRRAGVDIYGTSSIGELRQRNSLLFPEDFLSLARLRAVHTYVEHQT